MSIIKRLRAELELFDTAAKDEIHRFIDFLRLRNAEEPLPYLNTTPPIEPGAEPNPVLTDASVPTDPAAVTSENTAPSAPV